MNEIKKGFSLKKLLNYRKYLLDKAKIEYQEQLNICNEIIDKMVYMKISLNLFITSFYNIARNKL